MKYLKEYFIEPVRFPHRWQFILFLILAFAVHDVVQAHGWLG